MTSRFSLFILVSLLACSGRRDRQVQTELNSIDLKRGDVALCGSQEGQFGTVQFNISCADKVKANFNLATALLHSFEYDEAEKVFAKVIDEDPQCVMAYWGVAMSNYHELWGPSGKMDLEKGYKTVALARSLEKKSERESDYLEAIGAFYDGWDKLDHKTRMVNFEKAMESVYKKYPEDKEAAIFYALSLDATADPSDKSFAHQTKAGDILKKMYAAEPNHPGLAHYIIHNYDYPELAELGLPAARAYASIAPASAHAQHMPSHIFTRLGLWDESVKSNLSSISAAQCYAANVKLNGHWDEEFHGMDYLEYAYLQEGKDSLAKEIVDRLHTFNDPAAKNGKSAYVFAATPARFALERKQWVEASQLGIFPDSFPWVEFPWENAITHFSKLLGFVHLKKIGDAKVELKHLGSLHEKLIQDKEVFKANQVQIQINAGDAWIEFAEGKKKDALEKMTLAADMEDATAKPPVTPGEVIPARELLGDLLMAMNEPAKARDAYELDLKRHPNRLNGLLGAGQAEQKSGNVNKAVAYYNQLMIMIKLGDRTRPEVKAAAEFLKKNQSHSI